MKSDIARLDRIMLLSYYAPGKLQSHSKISKAMKVRGWI